MNTFCLIWDWFCLHIFWVYYGLLCLHWCILNLSYISLRRVIWKILRYCLCACFRVQWLSLNRFIQWVDLDTDFFIGLHWTLFAFFLFSIKISLNLRLICILGSLWPINLLMCLNLDTIILELFHNCLNLFVFAVFFLICLDLNVFTMKYCLGFNIYTLYLFILSFIWKSLSFYVFTLLRKSLNYFVLTLLSCLNLLVFALFWNCLNLDRLSLSLLRLYFKTYCLRIYHCGRFVVFCNDFAILAYLTNKLRILIEMLILDTNLQNILLI